MAMQILIGCGAWFATGLAVSLGVGRFIRGAAGGRDHRPDHVGVGAVPVARKREKRDEFAGDH